MQNCPIEATQIASVMALKSCTKSQNLRATPRGFTAPTGAPTASARALMLPLSLNSVFIPKMTKAKSAWIKACFTETERP